MRTPHSPIWLWAAALVLYVSWPVLMWFYWEDVGASGILPPESDSVIIPMVEGAALAIIASPFAALCLWLTLRRYTGGVPIWLPPRLRREWVWTVVYALIALLTVDATISLCSLFFSGMIALHAALVLILLLYLRAAAIYQARVPVL